MPTTAVAAAPAPDIAPLIAVPAHRSPLPVSSAPLSATPASILRI